MDNTPRKAKAHVRLPGYTPSGVKKDILKETHANTDKSENESMCKVSLHNVHLLPKVVIPDDALEISVEDMMERFKKRGLYDGERWVDWKDGAMSEKDISDFLNKLVDTAMEMLEEHEEQSSVEEASNGDGTSSQPTVKVPRLKHPRRIWTYEAMNKPIAGDEMNRKPDLVCKDERDPMEWFGVHVCGEDKGKVLAILKALRQGRGVTVIILRTQFNRRFVLGCTIADDSISIQYTDRSGTFVSGFHQIHKEPEQLVRIAVGLCLVEPQYLGYDTTLALREGAGKVTICNKEYKVLRNIFADSCIEGRGTMCFEVEHPEKEGVSCVMKDAWVDAKRSQKEADVLQKLNDLGVTNIPTVVASEVVQINGQDDSTKHIRRALKSHDCIARPIPTGAREGLDDAQAGLDAKALSAYEKVAGILQPLRNHHRILMEPFGKEFCKFRCLEEFLLAVKDIISVIKQLYDNRYLHRDVSINNVVLAERNEDAFQEVFKRLQGFLIDYDYALWLDREGPNTSIKAPVTGTVPFMAIELLQNFDEAFTHAYHHDLESLFYVICWICTTYSGPNGKSRFERYIEGTNVYKWNVQDFSPSSLKSVADSKIAFTSSNEKFQKEMKVEFHPYFAPIFDCVGRMRDCLFPTPISGDFYDSIFPQLEALKQKKDPEGIRKYRKMYFNLQHKDRVPQMVFEELFDAIDDARRKLSDEHRLKPQYPPDDGNDKPEDEKDHELNRIKFQLPPYSGEIHGENGIFYRLSGQSGILVPSADGETRMYMSLTGYNNEKEASRSARGNGSASASASSAAGKRKRVEEAIQGSRSSNKQRLD